MMQNNIIINEYLPIVVFFGVAILISVLIAMLPKIFAPHNPQKDKLSGYECGFQAFDDARGQVDIRFYLVAILFIIFDLEVTFLIPWAINLKFIGVVGFCSMMIFLLILIAGFIYEWKKGAIEWE